MDLDRTGNLLGALSLVLTDRTSDAVDEAAGRPRAAAAALSALLHFLAAHPSTCFAKCSA